MISEFDVSDADREAATELLSEYESETIGKWDLISDLSDAFDNYKIKYMFVLSELMDEGLVEYREDDDDFLIQV